MSQWSWTRCLRDKYPRYWLVQMPQQASVLLCDYQFAHATGGIQGFRVPAQVVVVSLSNTPHKPRSRHPDPFIRVSSNIIANHIDILAVTDIMW